MALLSHLGFNLSLNFFFQNAHAWYGNRNGNTPCTVQQCPPNYSFNQNLCSCEQIDIQLPTELPDHPNCNPSIRCGPAQTLDEKCRCICLHKPRCPGRTQFSPSTCTCECIPRPECNSHQFLNMFLCKCENINGPPIPGPPGPPGLPNPLPPCNGIVCRRPLRLNTDNCRCECPASADRCSSLQRLNPNTCRCECRDDSSICNSRQRLDSDTCRCRCVSVQIIRSIPTVRTRTPATRPGIRTGPGTRRTGPGTRRTGPGTRRGKRDIEIHNRVKRRRGRGRSRTCSGSRRGKRDANDHNRVKRRKGRSRCRTRTPSRSPGRTITTTTVRETIPGSTCPSDQRFSRPDDRCRCY